LLFSQYLHSRSQGHVARVIDEQLLGRTRSEARREEIDAVERALLGANFPSLDRATALKR
jgi:COMPASS component SWD3